MERGREKAAENLGTVTLVCMFWGKLISGREGRVQLGPSALERTLSVVHGISRKPCRFSCGPHVTGRL